MLNRDSIAVINIKYLIEKDLLWALLFTRNILGSERKSDQLPDKTLQNILSSLALTQLYEKKNGWECIVMDKAD